MGLFWESAADAVGAMAGIGGENEAFEIFFLFTRRHEKLSVFLEVINK